MTLDEHLAGRPPERVELTAYYVLSEALANVAKHAGGIRSPHRRASPYSARAATGMGNEPLRLRKTS